MLLGGCGLGGLLLFGAVFAWIVSGEDYGTDKQLDLAMHLLEDGRWDQADFLAREIEEKGELTPAREPVWNYIREWLVFIALKRNCIRLPIANCCGTRQIT